METDRSGAIIVYDEMSTYEDNIKYDYIVSYLRLSFKLNRSIIYRLNV